MEYWPVKHHIVTDWLSRECNKNKLDLRVDFINFTRDRLVELQEKTQRDETIQELKSQIHVGWPRSIKDVSDGIKNFWDYRDELA
jgi:hypothetical protein